VCLSRIVIAETVRLAVALPAIALIVIHSGRNKWFGAYVINLKFEKQNLH